MRIIDKYLLREFLLPVMYCFDAFLMLFIVQDLLEHLGDFIQYHARASGVLSYYMTILPEAFVMMLPMSLLLGVLFCLSNLGKNNELIALRACGVSVMRLALPLLAVGAIFSAILFVVNDKLVPTGKERADAYLNELRGAGSRVVMYNFFYANTTGHRNWLVGKFDTHAKELQTIEIHQQREDESELLDVYADSAVWTNGGWLFRDAKVVDHRGLQSLETDVAETNFPIFKETPRQLAIEGRKPEELSSKELSRHISEMRASHRTAKVAIYEVTLDYRYAFPFTGLIVIWLGIPLGVRTSRRGGALLGVGTALLLVVTFFFLTQITLAMGRGQRIPPLLAVWLTNAIFATVGAVLMAQSP